MTRTLSFRLPAALACAAVALLVAPAFAQEPAVPVVSILDVPGIIDRPVERSIAETLRDAEQNGAALVVLQLNSAGVVKASEPGTPVPPIAQQIADSPVPVAAWVGPGGAVASHGAMYLLEAAHVASAFPRATVGPLRPADLAAPGRWTAEQETDALIALAARQGRAVERSAPASRLTAEEARSAGLVDVVARSIDDLLRRIDGTTVTAAGDAVELVLPPDGTDVRFLKPGPLRRGLHTLANPALVFVLLLSAGMLIAFELFQPGFGVAGVTGGLLAAAAGYGLTVLPVSGWALGLLVAGLALLALDVALDGLGVPTIAGSAALLAGSIMLFPGAGGELEIPAWLAVVGLAAALVFFVPVMTVVRRARQPIAKQAMRALVGETGEVRSMLNPEGFVFVGDALWRARSETGERIRVGETVDVTGVDGPVVQVRKAGS